MFNMLGCMRDFFTKFVNNRVAADTKKRAFTLAELLIALAIVGIIVALVIPVVTTRMQNKTYGVAYDTEVKELLNSMEGLAVSENQKDFTETMMSIKHDFGAAVDAPVVEETARTTVANDENNAAAEYLRKYTLISKYCGNTPAGCFSNQYYKYNGKKREPFDLISIVTANEEEDAYRRGDDNPDKPELSSLTYINDSFYNGMRCALLKNGMSLCISPQVVDNANRLRRPVRGFIDINGPKEPNVVGRDLRSFSIDIANHEAIADNGMDIVFDGDDDEPEDEVTCASLMSKISAGGAFRFNLADSRKWTELSCCSSTEDNGTDYYKELCPSEDPCADNDHDGNPDDLNACCDSNTNDWWDDHEYFAQCLCRNESSWTPRCCTNPDNKSKNQELWKDQCCRDAYAIADYWKDPICCADDKSGMAMNGQPNYDVCCDKNNPSTACCKNSTDSAIYNSSKCCQEGFTGLNQKGNKNPECCSSDESYEADHYCCDHGGSCAGICLSDKSCQMNDGSEDCGLCCTASDLKWGMSDQENKCCKEKNLLPGCCKDGKGTPASPVDGKNSVADCCTDTPDISVGGYYFCCTTDKWANSLGCCKNGKSKAGEGEFSKQCCQKAKDNNESLNDYAKKECCKINPPSSTDVAGYDACCKAGATDFCIECDGVKKHGTDEVTADCCNKISTKNSGQISDCCTLSVNKDKPECCTGIKDPDGKVTATCCNNVPEDKLTQDEKTQCCAQAGVYCSNTNTCDCATADCCTDYATIMDEESGLLSSFNATSTYKDKGKVSLKWLNSGNTNHTCCNASPYQGKEFYNFGTKKDKDGDDVNLGILITGCCTMEWNAASDNGLNKVASGDVSPCCSEESGFKVPTNINDKTNNPVADKYARGCCKFGEDTFNNNQHYVEGSTDMPCCMFDYRKGKIKSWHESAVAYNDDPANASTQVSPYHICCDTLLNSNLLSNAEKDAIRPYCQSPCEINPKSKACCEDSSWWAAKVSAQGNDWKLGEGKEWGKTCCGVTEDKMVDVEGNGNKVQLAKYIYTDKSVCCDSNVSGNLRAGDNGLLYPFKGRTDIYRSFFDNKCYYNGSECSSDVNSNAGTFAAECLTSCYKDGKPTSDGDVYLTQCCSKWAGDNIFTNDEFSSYKTKCCKHKSGCNDEYNDKCVLSETDWNKYCTNSSACGEPSVGKATAECCQQWVNSNKLTSSTHNLIKVMEACCGANKDFMKDNISYFTNKNIEGCCAKKNSCSGTYSWDISIDTTKPHSLPGNLTFNTSFTSTNPDCKATFEPIGTKISIPLQSSPNNGLWSQNAKCEVSLLISDGAPMGYCEAGFNSSDMQGSEGNYNFRLASSGSTSSPTCAIYGVPGYDPRVDLAAQFNSSPLSNNCSGSLNYTGTGSGKEYGYTINEQTCCVEDGGTWNTSTNTCSGGSGGDGCASNDFSTKKCCEENGRIWSDEASVCCQQLASATSADASAACCSKWLNGSTNLNSLTSSINPAADSIKSTCCGDGSFISSYRGTSAGRLHFCCAYKDYYGSNDEGNNNVALSRSCAPEPCTYSLVCKAGPKYNSTDTMYFRVCEPTIHHDEECTLSVNPAGCHMTDLSTVSITYAKEYLDNASSCHSVTDNQTASWTFPHSNGYETFIKNILQPVRDFAAGKECLWSLRTGTVQTRSAFSCTGNCNDQMGIYPNMNYSAGGTATYTCSSKFEAKCDLGENCLYKTTYEATPHTTDIHPPEYQNVNVSCSGNVNKSIAGSVALANNFSCSITEIDNDNNTCSQPLKVTATWKWYTDTDYICSVYDFNGSTEIRKSSPYTVTRSASCGNNLNMGLLDAGNPCKYSIESCEIQLGNAILKRVTNPGSAADCSFSGKVRM